MIHVCFGLYDKTGCYSKFTGTAMLSMFENHNTPPPRRLPSITVHILHDNTLTPDNRDKFSYLAGQYGQLVKFYNVEELCADGLAEIKHLVPTVIGSRYSIATFYRLLIPRLFSSDIEKIIYLDSDIVVNLDIAELWQIDLDDKPLAAAPEAVINYLDHPFYAKTKFLLVKGLVAYEDYFCAGVLLVNLNYLRGDGKNLVRGMEFLNSNPEMDNFDQDILNYLYSKDYVKLNEKFDVFIGIERRTPERQNHLRDAIYHFAGATFGMNMLDSYNQLWMKYFIQTPWFDEETIGKLYLGVQQLHVGLKQAMVNLSAIMSGKTRGFFAPPNNVDGLKTFFSIRDDEEIILAENQDSLNKLIDAMNASRGRKIFFIMIPFPFQILIQAGFIPGRDFLNGLEFFSEAQGVPLNSYSLIQAM